MKAMDKAALLAFCRRDGRRVTAARRIIAEVIADSHDHPDVAEIHRRARMKDAKLSLSTVYRTLQAFAEAGLIERHSFEGRKARVEPAPNQHHDHLIDVDTGQVIEFRSDDIERLQNEMARKLGYELTGHRLELYGRKIS